ncbi:MAG: dihydroorotase [Parvibaculum sp.]|nr:dihydroorotase [Parvibaculum sp.]
MSATYDLIIKGGTVVNTDGIGLIDIGVRGGRIAAIGDLAHASAGEVIDARGLHVLPGVIDSQVHMREPGNEHKEDLETGGRAAVLGGVTAVFEMPNTAPATTTPDALTDKVRRAHHRMQCDFAFYGGATVENTDLLVDMENTVGCCGIKVFMGSSTGTLLVATDKDVARLLKVINRRAAFHSEDEDRMIERKPLALAGKPETHPVWRDAESAVRCTTRLLRLAREAGKRIHVLHITTADEIPLLAANKDIATAETTPQHLTLAAPDCYERLGTYAQMNPPIRTAEHKAGIWAGVASGVIDVLGSDHAPHTREEKDKPYPNSPSGMPGVQTLVPVMLDHVNAGRLSLQRFVDLTSASPLRIFGIARKGRIAVGYDADFTIVDMKAKRTITNDWIATRSGWTPFDGMNVTGWPIGTIIRGRRVMWNDEITGAAQGEAMTFLENLPKG